MCSIIPEWNEEVRANGIIKRSTRGAAHFAGTTNNSQNSLYPALVSDWGRFAVWNIGETLLRLNSDKLLAERLKFCIN